MNKEEKLIRELLSMELSDEVRDKLNKRLIENSLEQEELENHTQEIGRRNK